MIEYGMGLIFHVSLNLGTWNMIAHDAMFLQYTVHTKKAMGDIFFFCHRQKYYKWPLSDEKEQNAG
jgi:hypothetical protein